MGTELVQTSSSSRFAAPCF
ncbi:hypothetical protein VCHC41A1_3013, partial [Vibrio cholerae HC-41A1]